jgi:hypothetical protein
MTSSDSVCPFRILAVVLDQNNEEIAFGYLLVIVDVDVADVRGDAVRTG